MYLKIKGNDGEYHTSHSECTVCGIKRKTWRYRPTQYQLKTGEIVLGKAPACCEWQPILFDSCKCGGDIEVFTNAGPDKFVSGDAVECKACEKVGKMLLDPESTSNYKIQWNQKKPKKERR